MKRLLTAVVLLAGATACGGSSSHTITVFAASSMRVVLPQIATDFERAHPGVHIKTVFGASGTLVAQLKQGAPADLLITADSATMNRAIKGHVVRRPSIQIATNTLAIAVPKGNPKHVRTLADLTQLRVAACARTVPCGALAAKTLDTAHLSIRPTTYGIDAASTLTQLTTGEVDAALVYVTDARSNHAVTAIAVHEPNVAPNADDAAVTALTNNAKLATEFLAFLQSATAHEALAHAGFGP